VRAGSSVRPNQPTSSRMPNFRLILHHFSQL
jgi:hypothetical protein